MKNAKIKKMTTIALLMAMVIALQFIGSMIPPIGGAVSISLVLIPIVVGAACYGPSAGAVLGATFGVVTAMNCATGADPGGHMVFQASAIGCILVVLSKAILAGVAAGVVYRAISQINGYVAMLCAAIVCPLVNTGVFLASMFLFFKDVLAVWAAGAGADIFVYAMSGIVLCNFLPELLINIVFSPAGQRILNAVKK